VNRLGVKPRSTRLVSSVESDQPATAAIISSAVGLLLQSARIPLTIRYDSDSTISAKATFSRTV
jgi:hypothetical protein